MIGWPDAREQQKLGRIDRPAAEHHAPGFDARRRSAVRAHLHADCPVTFDQHALRQGLRQHGEVVSPAYGSKKGGSTGMPQSVFLRDLVEPNAFLSGAVEIDVAVQPERLSSGHERIGQHIVMPQIADPQFALITMPGVGAARVAFHGAKQRQRGVPRPRRLSGQLGPSVIVLRHTPHIAHGVDRTGAPEHPAPRPPQTAMVQLRLGLRGDAPVEALVARQLGDARRHADVGMPVRATGLDQQHPMRRVSTEPIGQHAARRTRADNHRIEFHRASCFSVSKSTRQSKGAMGASVLALVQRLNDLDLRRITGAQLGPRIVAVALIGQINITDALLVQTGKRSRLSLRQIADTQRQIGEFRRRVRSEARRRGG